MRLNARDRTSIEAAQGNHAADVAIQEAQLDAREVRCNARLFHDARAFDHVIGQARRCGIDLQILDGRETE